MYIYLYTIFITQVNYVKKKTLKGGKIEQKGLS